MNAIGPMIGVIGMILAVGWVVRALLNGRKQIKLTKMSNEMQAKILDKFEAGPELLRFLESPAGQRFGAPNLSEEAGYHRRVLGSVQTGIVLIALGGSLLYFSSRLPRMDEGMVFLGTLGVGLGLGFLVAALAAYLLSKRWGLIEGVDGSLVSESPVD